MTTELNPKKTKIVKFAAYFQLFIGLFIVFFCSMGIFIPLMNLKPTEIKNAKPQYKVQIEKALEAYYPEYKVKNNFWDHFVEYEIFDFKVGATGVSFCIDKDYVIWGIRLDDSREKFIKFSVFFEGNKVEYFENKLALPCVG